jgi:DNA-binding MarR family transcriptional regulator
MGKEKTDNGKTDNDRVEKTSNKKVIRQLINFAIKHRKIMMNYLDETGVYHAQHRLLMEISRNPNASQIDIARQMDVTAATIAVSLKKLEKEGYINREKDESDSRFNKITVTEKGDRVVKRSREIFESTDQKVLDGFTEEEKHTLLVLLQKLVANLTRMEDEIKLKKERT